MGGVSTPPSFNNCERVIKMKIGIAITSSGSLEPEIYRNHLSVLSRWSKEYDLQIYHIYDTPQVEALNMIVDSAIADECSHVFFMEHDNIYGFNTLHDLLAHDVDFVSGYYTFRNWPYEPIPLVEDGDGNMWRFEFIPGGEGSSLIEAKVACLGCSLIKIDAFKNVEEPYFDLKKNESSGKWCTVDIVLFEKLRAAGVKLFVDGNVRVGHLSNRFIVTPDNYMCIKKMVQVGFPECVTELDSILKNEDRITEFNRIMKG